jgi:uncharacterized repeat protein (TIGR01451 family)
MSHANFGRASSLRGIVGLIALCGMAAGANAQWTVVNLHPGAIATESEARSVYGGQQVGMANVSSGALLWNGSAGSVRKLNPLDGHSAVANGVYNGRQGGTVSVGAGVDLRTHGAIWTGAVQSLVDLHPGAEVAVHSNVVALDDTTQVGSFLGVDGGGGTFSAGRPCLWHGTAGSFVDLTPAGYGSGEARGTFGGQQVGATFDNFLGTACMWYGTAESFVNLQPEAALFSAAQCTDGVHQYGVIGILEPVPGLFPVQWSGTADSWELLDIPDPTTHWGEVHAAHGGVQVGYITDNDGISNSRACIWAAGPHSYADLQQYLPAPLTESNALGVWRHAASGTTYVVGYGFNATSNQREAVMWVNGPGVNLITSPAAPADDSAAVGEPITFTVRVLNAGPVAASPVTLTIDLPPASIATYTSAVPAPASVTATQVVFNLGSLAGSGAFTDVSITLTGAASDTATIVATSAATGEADPTNNAASASTHIRPPACVADFNGSGGVSVQDIFDFLAAYFSADARADVNHSGAITVQDIFDYLAVYFAGCA